jgi:hypothetical protein
VVQAVEDSPGDQIPVGLARARHGSLESERLMGAILAVAIAEQEPGLQRPVLHLPGRVPDLLGHPLAGRTGGDAAEVDLAAGKLDKEEDIEALEPGRQLVGRCLGQR